jgi:hypothetical protein
MAINCDNREVSFFKNAQLIKTVPLAEGPWRPVASLCSIQNLILPMLIITYSRHKLSIIRPPDNFFDVLYEPMKKATPELTSRS